MSRNLEAKLSKLETKLQSVEMKLESVEMELARVSYQLDDQLNNAVSSDLMNMILQKSEDLDDFKKKFKIYTRINKKNTNSIRNFVERKLRYTNQELENLYKNNNR